MPNYCNNCLYMDGNTKTIKSVIEFVKSGENVFDFEKIVPMPDNIYCGNVGDKEREIYGENNWYDWSIKNWGTKWNSIIAKRTANETQYDDSIVRQMIECIKVHGDGKLTIIFGGGYEVEEML